MRVPVNRRHYEIAALNRNDIAKTGLINIDIIRARRLVGTGGYSEGMTITSEDIFKAYEIKTSANGKVSEHQRKRYLAVVGGDGKKMGLVTTRVGWKSNTRSFRKNPKFESAVKAMALGGFTVGAVTQILDNQSYRLRERFIDQYKMMARKLRGGVYDGDFAGFAAEMSVLKTYMMDFVDEAVPGGVSDLMTGVEVRKALIEAWWIYDELNSRDWDQEIVN